jgi:dolichol-phosphate mannosyltransferase
MSLKKALIIIPSYNEAKNIKRLILSIIDTTYEVKGYTVDILVVDDYSPDGTGKIVVRLAQAHRNINLLSGKKDGLGNAYIRGLRYGLEKHVYDAFVMMDADLSHNPSYIPQFLSMLDQGYDYVVGSRYIQGGAVPEDWSILRLMNSKVANLLARKLTGIGSMTSDATGGYKAIRTKSLQSIGFDKLHVSGYFFQVALTYTFVTNSNFRMTEIPIVFANRKHGTSKLGLRDILEFIYRAYTLNPHSPTRRFVRFCMVGLSGVVVNLATLTILVSLLRVNAILSSAIAIEMSIASNFLLNHIYTFNEDSRSHHPRHLVSKFGKFNILSLVGAAITLTVFTVLYRYAGLYYVLAQALAIVPSVCFNYWASTTLVWKAAKGQRY